MGTWSNSCSTVGTSRPPTPPRDDVAPPSAPPFPAGASFALVLLSCTFPPNTSGRHPPSKRPNVLRKKFAHAGVTPLTPVPAATPAPLDTKASCNSTAPASKICAILVAFSAVKVVWTILDPVRGWTTFINRRWNVFMDTGVKHGDAMRLVARGGGSCSPWLAAALLLLKADAAAATVTAADSAPAVPVGVAETEGGAVAAPGTPSASTGRPAAAAAAAAVSGRASGALIMW